MFPQITNTTENTSANTITMGKSYIFDFSTGEFAISDGKVSISGENSTEGLKIWIEKILRTAKDRYTIYSDTDYGSNIEDLIIGTNYDISFVQSELKREIEESLLKNPLINSISNFVVTRLTNGLEVSFNVDTDSGTIANKVTL